MFNSYILVELDEKMLLIDKHAAHERIIFEQLKRNMYSHQLSSQLLMLPIDVMLMSDVTSDDDITITGLNEKPDVIKIFVWNFGENGDELTPISSVIERIPVE